MAASCKGVDSLLAALLAVQALEAFAYYTLNNILTLHLTATFHMTDADAGMHFGLRSAITTVFATLLGPCIDHIGPFRAMSVAFALAAAGRVGFAVAPTLSLSLAAMYGPMAAGHGLTNAALVICIKRATSKPEHGSPTWAFTLQYCALVLGITVCGPAIDLTTALLSPSPPYRSLALMSALCSAVALCVSLTLLRDPTSAGSGPMKPRKASPSIIEGARALRRQLCTARFARFAAFSIAILPGCAVLRNLDGGIFPKFMVRTFGPTVPKGTIYALNPLVDLVAAPYFGRKLRSRKHFGLIRVGLTIASLSPFLLLAVGPTLGSVVAFVLVLTLGDALYNPRLLAYWMAVAPSGQEGSFSGLSAGIAFLAELPAGFIGGRLLERYCSETAYEERGAAGCDSRSLFGALGAFAALTPLLLWLVPSLLREPSADVGGDAVRASEPDEHEAAPVEKCELMSPADSDEH